MPLFNVTRGKPHPQGATLDDNGVNFSLYSENADGVELLLFDKNDDTVPFQTIQFDRMENRTFHFWHVFVEGLKAGCYYNYRVYGPWQPERGHIFNPDKALLDPYGKGTIYKIFDRGAACNPDDNVAKALRSVTVDTRRYDWEGDNYPRTALKDTIIYEMHVGGFTRNSNSGVANPGTFKAVIEKIPYLKSLGVTAVELLPVFSFDDQTPLRHLPNGTPLFNYWGYSTVSFFDPHSSFCVNPHEAEHINEFRDMVKALHKEGIEVILDVVFNHTDEGNHKGPYLNFKGIDNTTYYYLVAGNMQFYYDYSGCGNTVKANHPLVSKFINDCLKFWVEEMHVDGFRFDEGSILSRGEDGSPMERPPLIWGLELSETFSDTKLIAETWEASGLNLLGRFPGYRWCEWNGKYRDAIRRFVKGDPGIVGEVATRISGSADLYQYERHKPINSINFIACHDGFNMMDLVSYNVKHNDPNGEDNRDGVNDNLSWNSGIEGASDNEDVNNFRKRRIKNFITILMLSQGVPMFLSGDEAGKSQDGNNNVYCQNNETSWFDWELTESNSDLIEYFSRLVSFRKANSFLRKDEYFTGAENSRGLKDIDWHGTKIYQPEWNFPFSRVLAFTMGAFAEGENDIHVMMNMHYQPLEFEVPQIEGHKWYLFSDTSKPGGEEFDDSLSVPVEGKFLVSDSSIVILILK